MKIDFNPYAIVYTDDVSIYDVSFIIIDENDKTIDVCDQSGFSRAGITYLNCEEIGYMPFTSNERLTGETVILIKNGELVI